MKPDDTPSIAEIAPALSNDISNGKPISAHVKSTQEALFQMPIFDYPALRARFVEKLSKAEAADQINQFAAALKAVTESERLENDMQTQRRNGKLEALKSWATIIVPLVSVLSLSATVLQQNAPTKQTRASLEYEQWNTTLTALAQEQRPQDDYTAIERLKDMFADPHYAPEARDVTIYLMPKMANSDTFQDLLPIVFSQYVNNDDAIRGLIHISRSLNANWDSDTAKINESGSQGVQQRKAGLDGLLPSENETLLNQKTEIYAEIQAVNSMLADRLRSRQGTGNLDFEGIWFVKTDLRLVNLQGSVFGQTVLCSEYPQSRS